MASSEGSASWRHARCQVCHQGLVHERRRPILMIPQVDPQEDFHIPGPLSVRNASARPPERLLVVQDRDLEGEVLLQVLDDHHEEGELDAERLARIHGARDVGGADIRALAAGGAAHALVPLRCCSRSEQAG